MNVLHEKKKSNINNALFAQEGNKKRRYRIE